MPTKMMPLTEVAALPWNDAYCECVYGHGDNQYDPDGVACDECLVRTWEDKVQECGDNFIRSVIANGIVHPIILNPAGTRVMNGHHRLALAIMLMLDEVPVTNGYAWDDEDDPDYPDSYD